jgi:hypothetical protein
VKALAQKFIDAEFLDIRDGGNYGDSTGGDGNVFSFSNNLKPPVETVPTMGKAGTRVIILGNNLTGSSCVAVNGVSASFTVESDTYIKATVPTGARPGRCWS